MVNTSSARDEPSDWLKTSPTRSQLLDAVEEARYNLHSMKQEPVKSGFVVASMCFLP